MPMGFVEITATASGLSSAKVCLGAIGPGFEAAIEVLTCCRGVVCLECRLASLEIRTRLHLHASEPERRTCESEQHQSEQKQKPSGAAGRGIRDIGRHFRTISGRLNRLYFLGHLFSPFT